ncbi:DUF6942 family protein [Ferrimonas pelagia]|uniref:Uncharacterized protein n=1 Tax=Ferrimonas pelagia TaxID=1177826 RepID=A0ABP9FC13_9GAMM
MSIDPALHCDVPLGLGDPQARLRVHIGNQPALPPFDLPDGVMPLLPGDIDAINRACGNGWRKVFSVYAKLLYQLEPQQFPHQASAPTWQQYRDQHLLQPGSDTALLYSLPDLNVEASQWQIVMGRTYGKHCAERLGIALDWLDPDFAVNTRHRILVCPYFDYRQLSNIKIERLAQWMMDLD